MNTSIFSWLILLLALFAANLPFASERLFGIIPIPIKPKPFRLRLVEFITLYFLVGFVAQILEARIGNAFAQGWEFYAVTVCLFIVFAYPGFVYRYLRKRRK